MRREIGLLLLATALFFGPPLLQGRLFVPADFLDYSYPWHASPAFAGQGEIVENLGSQDALFVYYPAQRFLQEHLRQGVLPWWDPGQGAGIPIFAAHDISTTFPGTVLPLLVLPLPAAWTVSQVLQVLATGAAMLGFLRALGISPRGSLVGALAWTFGNWPMAWLQLPSMGWPGAALPACLWALERRQGPLLALAFASLLVTAHLQLGFLASAFLVAWLAVRRPGWGVAAGLLVGGLLAAVELLPTAELAAQSERWTQEFSRERVVTNGTLTFRQLLAAVFPFAWGSPRDGFYLGGTFSMVRGCLEQCLYIGVLPLLLAARGARRSPGLAAMVAGAVLFAMGTLVYDAFYAAAPPFRTLTPSRVLFLSGFCLSVLAAQGWDAQDRPGGKAEALGLGLAAFLAAAWVLAQAASPSPWFQEVLQQGFLGAPRPPYYEGPVPFGELLAARVVDHFRWGAPAFLVPMLLLGASAVILALPWRKVQTAALGLVMVDLLLYAGSLHTPVPRERLFPPTPGIQALRERTLAGLRAAGLPTRAHPNLLAAEGIADVASYQSLLPGRYRKLVAALNGEPGTHQLADLYPAGSYGPPQADLLGVGVHYSDPRTRPPAWTGSPVSTGDLTLVPWPTGLRAFVPRSWRVATREEALAAVASPGFRPREVAWLEEDPGIPPRPTSGRVTVREHGLHRVVLQARLDSPGLVVLSDAWYPGWRAYVDGAERPILPVDAAFRAVAVPEGSHEIAMTFRPTSFLAGLAISALAACGWLAWWSRGRSRVSSGAGPAGVSAGSHPASAGCRRPPPGPS